MFNTLSRIALRYYLDSVTVILTAPSLQMYVMSREVTEQIVTQSRWLVEFSVSKWLKLTQFHLFPWDACGTPTVKIRFGCTQNCKASQ